MRIYTHTHIQTTRAHAHTYIVGSLLHEQLPEQHTVGPDVHLLRARLVAYDLRRHPPDSANKRHLRTLVSKLSAHTKVSNLQNVVLADEDAE